MPEHADAALLESAVREAGAHALTMFRQPVKRRIKSDGSPVTEADMAVNDLLRIRLATARPAYGWLSEETPDTAARLAARAIWIVDPIDGTRAFLNGTDEWCVTAALAINGRPVCGVVYRPVTGELYRASAGGGAWLDGKPIQVTSRSHLRGATVAGSSGPLKKLADHVEIEPRSRSNVPLALRLCYVASGVYDAAVSSGNKSDWDLAAGDLIVHEAGGKVTGLDGQRYSFNRCNAWQNGMVASSMSLNQAILSAMGLGNGKEGG